MRLLSFLFSLMLTSPLWAQDLSVSSQVESQRSQLGLSYEMSQFKAEEGQISGAGGRLHFFHTFNNSFSGQVYLSAALNQQGQIQNSFTGVGGTMFYNLFGQPMITKREVSLSGTLIATESTPQTQCLLIGAGLSQYFFNGNEGVYSASGLNFSAAYQVTLFKIRWEILARYNMLNAGSTTLTGTNYSAGILIPL